MKSFKDKIIIGIDHGYGIIKTANLCFKTGIITHDSEPLFTKDMLIYNGKYYLIGEGHKEFLPEKQNDEVLRTGTADIPDSDLEIITAIAEEYVAEIFRRLREHGYDESTMKLYICGGGGCLIRNFYHGNLDRVKFIDDICAAAKGYEYLADVYLRAEAKNEGRV